MITIGTDFEWFLLKNGNPYPAINIIEGTKDNPYPISNKGHFIQVDNVLIEGNVPPQTEDNIDNLVEDINFVKAYVNALFKDTEFTTAFGSSEEYDEFDLMMPGAGVFGCDVTYNAWENNVNPSPNSDTNLRSAALHIHIGYDNHTKEMSRNIVKAMDLMLGLPSLFKDSDTARRQLYGKAGEMRYTPYGFEYRVLGGKFLESDELMKWAFETAIEAVKFGLDNEVTDTKIREAIDTHNLELAKELLTTYNIETCADYTEV